MIRKFKRDSLRKQVGNKNMKNSWERLQKNIYGKKWFRVCMKTQGRKVI